MLLTTARDGPKVRCRDERVRNRMESPKNNGEDAKAPREEAGSGRANVGRADVSKHKKNSRRESKGETPAPKLSAKSTEAECGLLRPPIERTKSLEQVAKLKFDPKIIDLAVQLIEVMTAPFARCRHPGPFYPLSVLPLARQPSHTALQLASPTKRSDAN